jgi:uncharacterized membrane protein YcgQ (UPF0703/DUF1980 family)
MGKILFKNLENYFGQEIEIQGFVDKIRIFSMFNLWFLEIPVQKCK